MDGQENKHTPEQKDYLTSWNRSDSFAKDDSKECMRHSVVVEYVVEKSLDADNSNSEVACQKVTPQKANLIFLSHGVLGTNVLWETCNMSFLFFEQI